MLVYDLKFSLLIVSHIKSDLILGDPTNTFFFTLLTVVIIGDTVLLGTIDVNAT